MTREMKYSGVEWIGDIPSEWKVIKSKYIFSTHKEIVGDREKEFERLSLTLNGVLRRPKNDSKGLQSDSLSTYQILYQNELVFKMIDLENTSTSRVGYSPYTGLVSPVYIIFNNNEYSRYGYWYFYNLWQRNIYNTLGNNGVRSALNASDMLGLPFIKMPQEEQKKIADFLDGKVSEIDKIIAETKSSIEYYKEYKQSVITEAVTKGLDKNVPMKDSGIEWIGDIPVGWKTKPISICFKERNEKVSDYDWEPLSVTKQGILKQLETAAKSDAHDARKKVCVGDFVINSRSDRKQSCGISAYDGSVSLINIVLKHNKLLCSEYIKFALKNYGFAEEFYRWGNGIVDDLWSTNYQRMKKIMIPVPPLPLQMKIADFLDGKVSEIDNIIFSKEKLISNLEEYKKSLIYEYVTGKKAVE